MPQLDLARFRSQGQRFLNGFTTGQKVVTGIAIGAVVLGAFLFTRWSSSPAYSTLYTDLQPSDASAITQELDATGVPYELADGGTTIKVPDDQVYATRIDLSAEGLPSGGSEGYTLLDEQGITTSEFRQRVDYQRALQGELEKTIMAMDSVQAAKVNLVIPQDDVFVGTEEEQASAAVMVRAEGGRQLNPTQVQAVVNLVASSVPHLEPGAVTVTDATGNVLAAPGIDGMAGVAGSAQAQQTARYESELARSVQEMLAATLGPSSAVVRVKAQLDFDRTTETAESYAPPAGGPLPSSEVTSSETYTGPGSGATGVLGPDGTPLTPGDDTPVDYRNDQSQSQFAIDSVKRVTESAPGGVERLSVAVLLDSEAVEAAQVAGITAAVQNATGFDAARGDTIEVSRIEFSDAAAKAADAAVEQAQAESSQDFLLTVVRYVVTLLVVGLALLLAWRAVKKAQERMEPVRVPLDLRELEPARAVAYSGAPAAGVAHALEAERELALEADEPHIALEAAAVPRVQREIGDLIERQPEEVAQTLRSWLADRRS